MDMLILMIGGLVLTILFFMIFNFSWGQRKYAIEKFKLYREENAKFYSELESFITFYGAGSVYVFSDSDITYAEIKDAMCEKFDIEYSEAELRKLIHSRLSTAEISEYIERMKHQQGVVHSVKNRMNFAKSNFQQNQIVA